MARPCKKQHAIAREDAPHQKRMKLDISDYVDRKFPVFCEPQEIGHFSLDASRKYCPNGSQLKYLAGPSDSSSARFDLNAGYEHTIKKMAGDEKLDNLLKWVSLHKEQIFPSGISSSSKLPPDFICYRGLLTGLLCTPYETQDDWIICATKYRGTIYLCGFDGEHTKQRKANETEREKLMSFWGYKFEQYMTTNCEGKPPDTDAPVNENEEYCCVVKSSLDHHSLVYGAEVDCIDARHLSRHPADQTSTRRYAELKTSREVTSSRQHRNFYRFKMLKWWAQSFLIGIPVVVCGYRDDDGFVHSTRSYRVSEMSKLTKGLWSGSVCMHFCGKFLSFVKKCTIEDNPRVVYKYEWKPKSDITYTVLHSPADYQILPDWYVDEMMPPEPNPVDIKNG